MKIQRIAIARAVYSDAPILLDETTSALDELTEERVLKNLRQYRTKLVRQKRRYIFRQIA